MLTYDPPTASQEGYRASNLSLCECVCMCVCVACTPKKQQTKGPGITLNFAVRMRPLSRNLSHLHLFGREMIFLSEGWDVK